MTGHINDFVSEYVDGTLPPKTMEKVKSHLFFCNHCRNILKDMQDNAKRLKNLAVVAPPKGLEEKIISNIKKEIQTTETHRPDSIESIKAWFFSYKGLAVIATAVLVMVILKPEFFNFSKIKSVNPEESNPPSAVPVPFHPSPAQKEGAKLPPINVINKNLSVDQLRIKSAESAPVEKAVPRELSARKLAVPPPVSKQEISANVVGGAAGNLAAPTQPIPKVAMKDSLITNQDLAKKSVGENARVSAPLTEEVSAEPWTEIKGDSSGVTEPFQEVITDHRSWRRIWYRHTTGKDPRPSLPPVNFDTSDVIFICAGDKPTGGFALEILSVENTEWEGKPARVVTYQLKTPPENSMNITVITQPFIFRLVPKISGPTFFKTTP